MRTNAIDITVFTFLALVIAVFVVFGGCRVASAQAPVRKASKVHVVKANGKVAVCVAVTKTLTVCTLR